MIRIRRRLPLPLPLGAKFDPTDSQLISGYLSPKIRNEVLVWDIIGFSDEIYDKPPWDFCTDLTAVLDDEKHYFFTKLKRVVKGKNRVIRAVGSYGTWHESSTKKIYDSGSGSGRMIIGFNKLLNFKVKGEGKEMKTTDWLMHEYSVVEKGTDLVLCVIYRKNKKKEEIGLGLCLERPSVVDSVVLGSPKSVFDQVDFFDGIDDTGQDPYDDQEPFDENPRFAAIDGHSQFQVLDSQEGTKKMGSEVEGLDQEKEGMECQPLPLSFFDAHDPFGENPSPASPGDQEEIAEKMAYEVVDGIDEAEMEGLLLNLADDTEPYFDPLCFLDLPLDSISTGDENPCPAHDDHSNIQVLDSEEGIRPSKKMRYGYELDDGLNLVDDTFSGLSDIGHQPLSSLDLPLESWMGLYTADFSDSVFF